MKFYYYYFFQFLRSKYNYIIFAFPIHPPNYPMQSSSFFQSNSQSFSLIVMCVHIYIFFPKYIMTTCSVFNVTYVFKTDDLVMDNQLVCCFLGKTILLIVSLSCLYKTWKVQRGHCRSRGTTERTIAGYKYSEWGNGKKQEALIRVRREIKKKEGRRVKQQ